MSTALQTAPHTAAPVPTSPPRRRDPWFDNAKLLLVTLVVVGHSWELLLPEQSLARNWFYDFLYLWHMPAFVMVTGYLSRTFTWSRRNLRRLITSVGVPYLIFEASLAAFRRVVGGEDHIDSVYVDPHWAMWFLVALFLWRLATPLIQRLRSPLLVAVGVSLLGGLLVGDVLDMARVTGMLPFFVIGLVARREHVELLRRREVRIGAGVLLAVGFVAAAFIDGTMSTEWLYWRTGYDELGVPALDGMLVRLGLLAVSTLLGVSALALVPARRTWYTALGSASLIVYLCHGFFLRGADYAGLFGWTSHAPWDGLLVASLVSVTLALTLAAPPVASRLAVLVDPIGTARRRTR